MKYFLLTIILSHSYSSFGQKGFLNPERKWFGSIGYSYQGQNILEVGAKRTSIEKEGNTKDAQYMLNYMDFFYLILGGEVILNPKIEMAPKIGIGYHYFIGNLNLNLIGFNNGFQTFYPAFVPEIGLSFLGIGQINYGRNIYLANFEKGENYKNRISLRISMPKHL